MELKPGSRWRSAVSEVEVVVVGPPDAPVTLECGGHAMVSPDAAAAPPAASDLDGTTTLGKRYRHEESGLQLLVVKGGPGALSVDGVPLDLQDAKPLPSSD